MLSELLTLVGVLSKIKSISDLIKQERLVAMIEFLEKIAAVQIKTAIQELQAIEHSTRPEEELSRAIGLLKLAANTSAASLEKRPFLWRALGDDRESYRKEQIHLQIMGCHLIITRLYFNQGNVKLARQHKDLALKAFNNFATLRWDSLSAEIAQEFVGVAATDQAVHYFIFPSKQKELIRLKVQYQTESDSEVFAQLTDLRLKEMRDKLFDWLKSLKELN